jgi:hypothetical protein
MRIDLRPATQLCADSNPGGCVDVQPHRWPTAEQIPE